MSNLLIRIIEKKSKNCQKSTASHFKILTRRGKLPHINEQIKFVRTIFFVRFFKMRIFFIYLKDQFRSNIVRFSPQHYFHKKFRSFSNILFGQKNDAHLQSLHGGLLENKLTVPYIILM